MDPTGTTAQATAGRPAMAYDPDHEVVLLFGGVQNGTYFNDTWS